MARFEGIPVSQDSAIKSQVGGRFGGVPMSQADATEVVAAPGFVSDVSKDLSERNRAIQETMASAQRGDIGAAQGAAQAFGSVAGGALDVVGAGLSAVGRGISEITPEAIKEPVVEAAKDAWEAISSSDIGIGAGEAIKGGVEKYNEWANENPNAAKTVGGLTNIAMLFAPAKFKAQAEPSVFGKAALSLEAKAEKQLLNKRNDFVGDLISPKKTPTVKVEEVARTTEKGVGPMKRSVVELSGREKQIADEVAKIGGVTSKKSIQGNYNAIVKENSILAEQLEREVGKRRVLIGGVDRDIDSAVSKLIAENPTIVNSERVATRVADKAKQIIAENDSTAAGLLKSRKEFDGWIRRQKGDKAFDPAMENALSVSVRTVRDTMNNKLDASIGSTSVKKELKRQSLLYDAIENLAPKAADESNYAIGRALQNISKVLPWRRSFQTDVGALMGLGIIGSSELLAPIFAGGLAATTIGIGTKNLATSAATKKALAGLIKGIDRAIVTSKNPSMVKQLRADRALILELTKNAEVIDEE